MNPAPISGRTRLLAVIGSPITHSLSPAIHNSAFAELAVDWRLMAFDIGVEQVDAALGAIGTLGIAGVAVTAPLKTVMAGAVDVLDQAASAMSAVNTVIVRPDGATEGLSTDGDGFVTSLRRAGHDPARRRVVVLGAGGAARSIIEALGRAGCVDIAVVNRSAPAARRAAELSAVARVGTVADVAEADILVNATSVGMNAPDQSPIDVDWLRPDLLVADAVYQPIETELLRAARALGAVTVDGLGMLVCQAQLQQQRWIGASGSFEVMHAAAQAELASR